MQPQRERDFGPLLNSLFPSHFIVAEFPVSFADWYVRALGYDVDTAHPETRVDWVVFREDKAHAIQAKLQWDSHLVKQAIATNKFFPFVYLLAPTPPTKNFIKEHGLDGEYAHFGLIYCASPGKLKILRQPMFHLAKPIDKRSYQKRLYYHLYRALLDWLDWQEDLYPKCRYDWPIAEDYVCPFLRGDGTCAWERPPLGVYGGCEFRTILNHNDVFWTSLQRAVARWQKAPRLEFDEVSWRRFSRMYHIKRIFRILSAISNSICETAKQFAGRE